MLLIQNDICQIYKTRKDSSWRRQSVHCIKRYHKTILEIPQKILLKKKMETAAKMVDYFSSTRIVLIPNYVMSVLVYHLAVEIADLSHKDFFKITLYGASAFRNIAGSCILHVYQFKSMS